MTIEAFTPTQTSHKTITTASQQPQTGQPTLMRTPTPTHTSTPTRPLAPPTCQPPLGWQLVTLQPGESFESLAQKYGNLPILLAEANCLAGETLPAGMLIYLPPITATQTPTLTATPTPTLTPTKGKRPRSTHTRVVADCYIASGWALYTVQAGDTLYSIGQIFGMSAAQIQAGNCMGSNTLIHTGEQIYVPYPPPSGNPPKKTPKPTAKPTRTQPVESPQPPPVTTNEPLPTSPTSPEPPAPPPVDSSSSATGSRPLIYPPISLAFWTFSHHLLDRRFLNQPLNSGYLLTNGCL